MVSLGITIYPPPLMRKHVALRVFQRRVSLSSAKPALLQLVNSLRIEW